MLKKIRRKVIVWVSNTGVYRYLLKHVIPYIRFTTYYPTMRGSQYHEAYKNLRPGDIILCQDYKKLTSKIIGGEFSHAAFCIGKHEYGHLWETIDMTHEDCRRASFFDIAKESDRIVIMRCPDWTEQDIVGAITKAQDIYDAKIPYDHQFKLGVKALYCSELIVTVDVNKKLIVSYEDLVGIGRPYISPDGLYRAKNLITVHDTRGTS